MPSRLIRLQFAKRLKISNAVISVAVRIVLGTHAETSRPASDTAAIAIFFASAVAKEPKSLVEVTAATGIAESLLRLGYSAQEGLTGVARYPLVAAVSEALDISEEGASEALKVLPLMTDAKKDTKKRQREAEDV